MLFRSPLRTSGTAPFVPRWAERRFHARWRKVKLDVRSKYWPWISALSSSGEARDVEGFPSPLGLITEDSRLMRLSCCCLWLLPADVLWIFSQLRASEKSSMAISSRLEHTLMMD